MHPPTKDQTDIGKENVLTDNSDGATIIFSEDLIIENEDMARQEYAQEADINYMLSRFGVTPRRGDPTYGETDDTVDLQNAIHSVREARAGYYNLPKEIREKFPNMESMLAAIENGSFVIKNEEAPKDPETPEETAKRVYADLDKAREKPEKPE